ncbi:hypothetical protein [Geodermatophilus sp. DSM 45219]|uniref:hypothetical protein n=1 Tax=Geodermatophilus sp. DSM 45219 TaxID=1881103 RepID=UPI00088E1DC8|nr:hypothetical protein [Geodermatophilus sp. DSM 45219]SDN79617.1 hypothetical protein SAMN05428965_1663 [Geodermatophilus sp. DSM 45219]
MSRQIQSVTTTPADYGWFAAYWDHSAEVGDQNWYASVVLWRTSVLYDAEDDQQVIEMVPVVTNGQVLYSAEEEKSFRGISFCHDCSQRDGYCLRHEGRVA